MALGSWDIWDPFATLVSYLSHYMQVTHLHKLNPSMEPNIPRTAAEYCLDCQGVSVGTSFYIPIKTDSYLLPIYSAPGKFGPLLWFVWLFVAVVIWKKTIQSTCVKNILELHRTSCSLWLDGDHWESYAIFSGSQAISTSPGTALNSDRPNLQRSALGFGAFVTSAAGGSDAWCRETM